MSAATTLTRRLPGFQFEAQSPPLTEFLPRMDVAVFIGFAASGPLHQPVAVEDAAQFAAIFGEDAPLVWDRQRGETVYAYLAPAVRAFFRNGGRRCWVVRIAARTRPNLFQIPGLAELRKGGSLVPVYAQARSQGSWSDSLQTSAQLLSRPVIITHYSSPTEFDLEVSSPGDVLAGDILRLTFDEGYVPLVVVQSATLVAERGAKPETAQSRRINVHVQGGMVFWFRLPDKPPLRKSGRASVLTVGGRKLAARADLPDAEWKSHQSVTVNLRLSPADAPLPGSFVRLRFGKESMWLRVEDVRVMGHPGKSGPDTVQVSGEALWRFKTMPEDAPASRPTCEKLLFELRTRRSDADPLRLSDLGFTSQHPRFWGALPTDELLYADAEASAEIKHEAIWQAASSPRFPLAGRGVDSVGGVYLPVAMSAFSSQFFPALKPTRSALERDGLARFNTNLFLDTQLKEVGTDSLMSQADFLRYESPTPRALRGMHAALAIEEATLIAVPDVAHRGWETKEEALVQPKKSEPLAHPEWWSFLDCDAMPQPQPEKPLSGNFLDCSFPILDAPTLESMSDEAGTLTLSWSPHLTVTHSLEESTSPDWRGASTIYTGTENHVVLRRGGGEHVHYRVRSSVEGFSSDWLELESGAPDEDGRLTLIWPSQLKVAYVLEEATKPDWTDASPVYSGAENRLVLYGRHAGSYYYRVRVLVKEFSSNWSNGVGVLVKAARGWQLKAACDYLPTTLLEVQCALLRMCAARGDLFAVLAVPEHYREEDAERHVKALKPSAEAMAIGGAGPSLIAPLGFGETRALSYGALYYPWLVSREDRRPNKLRRTPPDGAATGVLARRALNRGAWVAPANELLRDVVAQATAVERKHWPSLQEAQINLIRQEPRGFLSLSADTLSDEAELRPINVRRLLILLRRQALRLGATYVFEPNNDSFRRLVKRGFEAMLDRMFTRGAFAGAQPSASYQVLTSSTLNTQQMMDEGRFIVELKVAPSLPMTFLTIRLVQTGDRLSTEEQ